MIYLGTVKIILLTEHHNFKQFIMVPSHFSNMPEGEEILGVPV